MVFSARSYIFRRQPVLKDYIELKRAYQHPCGIISKQKQGSMAIYLMQNLVCF